jgi:CheY-like chemotaxis protein
MHQPAFVLGVDPARLRPVLPLLGRDVAFFQGRTAGHNLLEQLDQRAGGLVVLGPSIPDLTLAETIKRIRQKPETRHVSILALSSRELSELPGANVVLPAKIDVATLAAWISKLSSVPPRVPLHAKVSGRTSEHGARFCGVSQDISLAGMRVVCDDELPFGENLDLWLELASAPSAIALGRVVRRDPEAPRSHGYGVEFLYVPPATQEAIERIVEGTDAPVHVLRGRTWICEILRPLPQGDEWEVEVLRARTPEQARERFLSVSGATAEEALEKAREVARAWMQAVGADNVSTRAGNS